MVNARPGSKNSKQPMVPIQYMSYAMSLSFLIFTEDGPAIYMNQPANPDIQ